jgi:hypothetical protein
LSHSGQSLLNQNESNGPDSVHKRKGSASDSQAAQKTAFFVAPSGPNGDICHVSRENKAPLRDAILLMKRSLSLPPFNNGIFAGCWDPQISITETPTAKTTISLSFSPLETSFLVRFVLVSPLQFFMLVFSLFCNNFNINFYFLWLLLLLF